MAEHSYFPIEFLQLQEELAKNPMAQEWMTKCESQYLEDRLAHLCTFCNILVDDDFDIEALSDLAGMITRNLYEMRTGLVTTH